MRIQTDKVLHFVTGFAGGVLAGAFLPLNWALAVTLIPGPAKEALDAWQNHQAAKAGKPAPHSVEFLDALATTIGAWAGVFLATAWS